MVLTACFVFFFFIALSAVVFAINHGETTVKKLQLKYDELSKAAEERDEWLKEMEEKFRFVEVQEKLAKTQDERIRSQNKRLEEVESTLLASFALIERLTRTQEGFSKTQSRILDHQDQFLETLKELRDQLLKSLPPNQK